VRQAEVRLSLQRGIRLRHFPLAADAKRRADRSSCDAAGREVRRIREESLPKLKGGLRALYRTPELPGVNPLKAAHAALDSAVLAAYGFSPKADLLAQLLVLVAGRLNRAEPITAPVSLPISPIWLGSSRTTASTTKGSHRSSKHLRL
jgi:hypothetical protein